MTNERGGLLPVPSPPHHPPRILQPRPRAPLAHALCACGLPPTKINPPHAGNRHSQEARLVPSSSLARAFRLLDPSAPMPKRRRDGEVRGCARAREGGVESGAVVAKCVGVRGRRWRPCVRAPPPPMHMPSSRSIHCRRGGDGMAKELESTLPVCSHLCARGGGARFERGITSRATDRVRHP